MDNSRPAPPLRVFLSYSHHDEELCKRFLVHTSELRRQGLIEPWHDRCITPGAEWAGAIDDSLNTAHIIVLLVSPDFLASDYCNDVEMKRALERAHAGQARLVPVILKPCDWQISRFAGFQVLPKDGKPVVDWKSEDHAFDNVVTGLHRLILELRGPAPVGVQVLQMAVRRRPGRWAGGAIFAALLIAALVLRSAGQRYLKQGTDLLNTGQYAEARPALERAKSLNPLSPTANCGVKAVEMEHSDEQQLDEAIHELPNCAYLKVLRGGRKYLRGDLSGALADYQAAAQREARLAEAHFNIGRVLDLQDKPDSAQPEYEMAATLSPSTARYHHNLADLYFRAEDYDKAIEQYGLMGEFPLAALELAKIYRLQGKLEEARGREDDAIRWLNDPTVQRGELQNGWAFQVSPIQQVRLGPLVEKQCYAQLELAMTRFLAGDENQAAVAALAAFEKCSSRRTELRAILSWELHRLSSENPKLVKRWDKVTETFVGAGQ